MTRKTLISTALVAALGIGVLAVGVAEARGPGGWGGGPCGGPHAMTGGGFGPQMLFQLDTDDDGVITKAEFDARHQARFEALDADGDGAITKAELRKAFDKFQAQRRGPWWSDDDGDKNERD